MKITGWTIVIAAVGLMGCASQPEAPVTAKGEDFTVALRCGATPAPEQQVELEVVDTLTSQQRPYAALAHAQRQLQRNPEYWQRYGQLLAQTGDLQRAEKVFERLRNKCNSGEGWQGDGLVALRQGDLQRARRSLEQAVNLTPASAAVRNDYGYVLLLSGEPAAAIVHLRTALELQNGSGPARQNLATAYVLTNNNDGLVWLQEQYRFTEQELVHARTLANTFRVTN